MSNDEHRTIEKSPAGLDWTDGIAMKQYDAILLFARVCVGWIFVQSGIFKLLGWQRFSTRGWPAEWFFGPLGAIVELIGGVMLMLGLATRYASLVMLLFMIIATFSNHRYWDYPPAEYQGQRAHFFKNLSIFGGFLIFYAVGAGRMSLDWIMARGKRAS